MTRIVIHVASAGHSFKMNALLQQIFVNIDDTTTWENFIEFIALQLVVAGSTRNDDSFDIKIIQGVSYPMKQYAIISNDFFCFIKITGTTLRITTAQISWRQHSLHTTCQSMACVAKPTCENNRSDPQPGK